MALILGTAISNLVVGSSGSQTFCRNRGGNYVKPRIKSNNPKSSYQMTVRGLLSGVVRDWQGLTTEQQKSWNKAAPDFPYTNKIGQSKIYSGYSLFCKLNMNLAIIGETSKTYPPDYSETGFVTEIEWNHLDSSNFQFTVYSDGPIYTNKIVTFASKGQSNGIGVISPSTFKFITAETASRPYVKDILTPFNLRGYNVVGGMKYFIKCFFVDTNTGIASGAFISSKVAT